VFNPFDGTQVDDQWGALAQLRRDEPVAEVMPGVFLVTRHDDVDRIARDHASFGQGGFSPLAADERPLDLKNLGETDPPVHTWVRQNLAGAMSPARLRAWEPAVRAVCRDVARELAGRQTAEIVEQVGVPVPVRVVTRLGGLPETMQPALRAYSNDVVLALAQTGTPQAEAAGARIAAFDAEVLRLVSDRRAQPEADRPTDLLSALVACRTDQGDPITDQRVVTHLTKDVIVGGVETTTHAVANLFYDLLSAPEQYARLRADRSLVDKAVEESLRHLAPVLVVMRRALVDTEIAGVAVPAGSVVVLSLGSAGRDEAVCPHAARFDLDRERRLNPAFSAGIHHCVGAPLARLELRCLLEEVLDAVPGLELADREYARVQFFMFQGPRRLAVRVTG